MKVQINGLIQNKRKNLGWLINKCTVTQDDIFKTYKVMHIFGGKELLSIQA